MFGSDIVDAAVGLFLVFFLFSLLCSVINEWIVGHLWGLRAKVLENVIKRMLGDVQIPSGSEKWSPVEGFFAQPLIKSLTQKDETKPSYISSAMFVDALLALVQKKSPAPDPNAVGAPLPNPGGIDSSLAELKRALKTFEGTDLERILQSYINDSKNLPELKQKLETWFDECMDRATGWYKKHITWCMAGIALVVAIGFNVDTFILVKELMGNSKLRATLVASAEEAVKQPVATNNPTAGSNTVAAIEKKITDLQLPIGWLTFTNSLSSAITTNVVPTIPDAKIAALTNTSKVCCWLGEAIITNISCSYFTNGTTNLAIVVKEVSHKTHFRPGQTYAMRFCGWLVTAAALSFGAPFWFDLLGKIVNLRAAGKKPDPREKDEKK